MDIRAMMMHSCLFMAPPRSILLALIFISIVPPLETKYKNAGTQNACRRPTPVAQ
jgi:hypothetical protein